MDQIFSSAFGYTLNREATDITYLLLIGIGMRVAALAMMLTLVGGLESALSSCPCRFPRALTSILYCRGRAIETGGGKVV